MSNAEKNPKYVIPKFDLFDVDEFAVDSLKSKMSYSLIFIIAVKEILAKIADLASFVVLIATNTDAIDGFLRGMKKAEFTLPNSKNIGFLKFVGIKNVVLMICFSLIISFILLFLEWRKARRIIKSKDISFAFTSVIAKRFYCIKSYSHFCFFSQINNSKKGVDKLAFAVFFAFKGWKRLIFAEMPRVLLNVSIMVALWEAASLKNRKYDIFSFLGGLFSDFHDSAYIFFILQCVTVSVWLISASILFFALIAYIPLRYFIRQDLKEYCVRIVDKRLIYLI
jgi:hypothetical protein